jgi:hypothetical protein
VAQNPTLAHIGFIEPYAAGPRAEQSMDKLLRAFTVFLADGDAHLPPGHERPTSVAREAIAATIFEMGFQQVRTGKSAELPALLPQAVFLVLAPFLGAEEAGRFVVGKLRSPACPPSSSQ